MELLSYLIITTTMLHSPVKQLVAVGDDQGNKPEEHTANQPQPTTHIRMYVCLHIVQALNGALVPQV